MELIFLQLVFFFCLTMGCIQTLDGSSITDTNATNNKRHEYDTPNREDPSDHESTPISSSRTNLVDDAVSNNVNDRADKRDETNPDAPNNASSSEIYPSSAESTLTAKSAEIAKKMRSNSFNKQSVDSISVTSQHMDSHISSHIHNNRVGLTQMQHDRIDEEPEEEEEDANYSFIDDDYIDDRFDDDEKYESKPFKSNRSSPNSPPLQIALPAFNDNTSNTLHLEDDHQPYSTIQGQLQINASSKHSLKALYDEQESNEVLEHQAPVKLMKYRKRYSSQPNTPQSTAQPPARKMRNTSKAFARSKSSDESQQHDKKGRKQSDQDLAVGNESAPNLSALSKYAYNARKNGKINTSKHKNRLQHAKSKSIPQNLFVSSLSEYQTEESNTYEYLSQITHFDQHTLRLLHLRFNHIDSLAVYHATMAQQQETNNRKNSKDQKKEDVKLTNGKLDIHAIALILGLPTQCILVKRFFDYMDQHAMGQVSFRVFARTMSILSDKASMDEKCELSFNLYDLNDDQVIDRAELKTLVDDLLHSAKEFIGPLLLQLTNEDNSEFVNKLIENTMDAFDLDSNGNITYPAYCKFIKENPHLLAPFTLDVEKLLDYEAEQRRMNRISINSLKKKKLRQLVIGQDPKKAYNKKWHKPQWYKQMEKDQIQHVNSIRDANEICADMLEFADDNKSMSQLNETGTELSSSDSEMDEVRKKEKEDKEREEQMQSTIALLYD